MTPPRVALITNFCPHYRRDLFDALSERMRVTFYFFSHGNEPYRGSLQHEPGDIAIRDVRNVSVGGQPLMLGLQGELSRENYDVVVKCINGKLMLPYVFGLTRRRGLPFVLWTGIWHHPRTPVHRLTRRFAEHVYRESDAIVAYGRHVRRFVEAVPGVSTGKTFVTGQAIDASGFSAVTPSFADPPVVLFIGRLGEDKGIDDLLTAFSTLKDPRLRLRLVGTGPLLEAVQRRARVDPRIETPGHLPQRDLPRELARARCLVLPSVTTARYREAWGLVINEAMAAGVPVVTTDAVGAAAGGLVVDRVNGLVVPERRPEALAGAIGSLLADREVARSYGARAREDVSKFDYPRMAEAFVGAVDHAMAHTGRA